MNQPDSIITERLPHSVSRLPKEVHKPGEGIASEVLSASNVSAGRAKSPSRKKDAPEDTALCKQAKTCITPKTFPNQMQTFTSPLTRRNIEVEEVLNASALLASVMF